MAHEENCIFCKIINKEIPAKIIFEDEKNIALLDIFPINEGHTIIIPKCHYQNIEEIPEKDFIDLFKCVKKIAQNIHEKLEIDGYNILQNNFPAAGQIINHIHIHIIPRKENDKKFALTIPREQATEEELNKILFKLKN
ncbi:MAG: HIT domain-containing protein [Promethearchaeota archaeon]